MPETVRQVRGDARTDELAALNAVEVPPMPEELEEWSARNPVYIFSVCPEPFAIEHPLVGKVTVPACKPGEQYSDPLVLPGLIPYGVRLEMKTAELRNESGRQFAVDILGIGQFKDARNSLIRRGVFIAAQDTFDAEDRVPMKLGRNITATLPRWVNTKYGKCAAKPTQKELERAHVQLATWDVAKIAEADRFWDNGPADKEQGQGNITAEHRQALRRRGQTRPWDQPIESLIACPGCQERIRPGVIVHNCGYVLDWDKAIAGGMRKAEDRPKAAK
jgi:hypothetical protein